MLIPTPPSRHVVSQSRPLSCSPAGQSKQRATSRAYSATSSARRGFEGNTTTIHRGPKSPSVHAPSKAPHSQHSFHSPQHSVGDFRIKHSTQRQETRRSTHQRAPLAWEQSNMNCPTSKSFAWESTPFVARPVPPSSLVHRYHRLVQEAERRRHHMHLKIMPFQFAYSAMLKQRKHAPDEHPPPKRQLVQQKHCKRQIPWSPKIGTPDFKSIPTPIPPAKALLKHASEPAKTLEHKPTRSFILLRQARLNQVKAELDARDAARSDSAARNRKRKAMAAHVRDALNCQLPTPSTRPSPTCSSSLYKSFLHEMEARVNARPLAFQRPTDFRRQAIDLIEKRIAQVMANVE